MKTHSQRLLSLFGLLLSCLISASALAAAPSITSISHNYGAYGAVDIITGTNFGASQGTSTLTVNGAVASPSSWSNTSITFAVPSGAALGAGDIVVTVGNLASNGLAFTAIPVAAITSISPTSGDVGTVVTITGTNLEDPENLGAVVFDGKYVTESSQSPTQVQFAIPSGATSGNVAVNAGGVNSNSVPFTFTSAPLQFIPMTPCRVVDTRNAASPFGGPELAAAASREFDIPQSSCGIPTTAVAYSLNATVVPNAALDYLTLWPSGQAQPNVSTLNSDGRIKANAAITSAGTSGGVSVYASDATQFILDIDGYFVPAGTSSALAFYPITPCRIADTRNAAGPLGGPSLAAGGSRNFPIQSSSCGLPSDVQAYSLNVTALPQNTLSYLTSWPTGQAQPYVSTLNSTTGTIVANGAIVSAGSNGEVSVFVTDAADVLLDVNGYFAPPAAGGLSLYTVTPCRVLDTRPNSFTGTTPVNVQGSACAPPSAAQAYVLNATVMPVLALSYLTLWPGDGSSQPNVSTLNALDGAITSNMAIVPTSNGSMDAFADGFTNLIIDMSSYFAP